MGRTLVLEKVAHPCSTGEDELGDVFDDLGFRLGRERLKPFRQSDFP